MNKLMMFCLLLLLSLTSFAAEPHAPHKKIEQVTADFIEIVKEAKAYYDNEPERYYQEVSTLVDPLLDFPTFTRSVMGVFGTRDYYLSLDEQQRKQYKADYKRFVDVFRQGLVSTYGKGLLAFNGQKIVVEQPDEKTKALIEQGKPVTVKQVITGDKAYVVLYKMSKSRKGEWKIRNVVIESINVGKLYHNQFQAAMSKHNNDFPKVIDEWVVDAQGVQK